MQPFHRIRVDAAHRVVQHDATEDFDARHHLHHQRSAARGLADVVLEHDAAHAARLGELGHVDVVHVATEDIRVRVDVHVNHAGSGTDLGRGRRERGLCERIIKRQQG
jgi:hypothetical protein